VLTAAGSYAITVDVQSTDPAGLTGTYVTKGAQISMTETCYSPALPTVTSGFTSEGKQLVVFGNVSGGVAVTVYTMM
jgi:hypothetical protein